MAPRLAAARATPETRLAVPEAYGLRPIGSGM